MWILILVWMASAPALAEPVPLDEAEVREAARIRAEQREAELRLLRALLKMDEALDKAEAESEARAELPTRRRM